MHLDKREIKILLNDKGDQCYFSENFLLAERSVFFVCMHLKDVSCRLYELVMVCNEIIMGIF